MCAVSIGVHATSVDVVNPGSSNIRTAANAALGPGLLTTSVRTEMGISHLTCSHSDNKISKLRWFAVLLSYFSIFRH